MKRKSFLCSIPLVIFIFLLTLPAISWEQSFKTNSKSAMEEKRIYLKAGIGGGGVEDIPLKMWLTTGEEVKVKRWIFRHLNLEIGCDINPKLGIEVGLGRHHNSIESEIIGGDGCFNRTSLTATGIYRFFKEESVNVYCGLGIGCYIAPELYREGLGIKTTVYYEDAFGPHLSIGTNIYYGEKWGGFVDLKYVFGIKYKFKEGKENGVKFTSPPFNEWKEINGSGLLVNVGVGYRF